jgi:PhnB protein
MSKTGFPIRHDSESLIPARRRTTKTKPKTYHTMSTATVSAKFTASKSIPKGMHTVTPHLICAGASEAIDFYKKAFNAEEVLRLKGPDGKLMHANVRIGDSSVMLVDENIPYGMSGPKALKGSPVSIHLQVTDADAAFTRAVGAGAKVVMPLADMFWGDRFGVLEDPFGHRWTIAHRLQDLTPEQMQAAALKACESHQGCQ